MRKEKHKRIFDCSISQFIIVFGIFIISIHCLYLLNRSVYRTYDSYGSICLYLRKYIERYDFHIHFIHFLWVFHFLRIPTVTSLHSQTPILGIIFQLAKSIDKHGKLFETMQLDLSNRSTISATLLLKKKPKSTSLSVLSKLPTAISWMLSALVASTCILWFFGKSNL